MKKGWSNARLTRLLFTIVIVVALLINIPAVKIKADENYTVLDEVFDLIDAYYVDEIPPDAYNALSIDELITSLNDPHTAYFTAEEYQDFINIIDNIFSGIGVYMDIVPEGVLVTGVIEGAPADEAGIVQGDILVEADGKSLAGLSTEQAQAIIRGPEGSVVTIRIKREEEFVTVDVVRGAIIIPTVESVLLDGHIGYIRISTFGADTSEEFYEALSALKEQNADSFIVDLRNNGGGYLYTAIDLAGYFIGDELAVITRYRDGTEIGYYTYQDDVIVGTPVIFLVNDYSASASEILAAAVKDHKKAFLVGSNTYGKGSVQTFFQLSDGSVLKLTTQKFFSPEGNTIDKEGVSPDLDVEPYYDIAAAELLLGKSGDLVNKDGFMKIENTDWEFEIDLLKARLPEYWSAYRYIMGGTEYFDLSVGTPKGWQETSRDFRRTGKEAYYPRYNDLGEFMDVPWNSIFHLNFTSDIDADLLSGMEIELRRAATGENVPAEIEWVSDRKVRIDATEAMYPGEELYLLVHDTKGREAVFGEVGWAGTIKVSKSIKYIKGAKRLQGSNRFKTAASISRQGWRDGADTVVIVNGMDYSHAIAGIPLAYLKDSPILYTTRDALTPDTLGSIQNLKAQNIILLGGEDMISKAVEEDLAANGYNVERIAGSDKFETAAEIASLMNEAKKCDTAVIVTGDDFADGMAVGPYAAAHHMPLLYTGRESLNESTRKALEDVQISNVLIVGATGAVSAKVEEEILSLGIDVQRLSGKDRYLTSLAVTRHFDGFDGNGLVAATGDFFPDGAAGSVYAAKKGLPMILMARDIVNEEILEYLNAEEVENLYILGGCGALSQTVEESLIYRQIMVRR